MNGDVLLSFKIDGRIPALAAGAKKDVTKPIKLSQLLFGFPVSVGSLLASCCSIDLDLRL